MRGMHPRLMMAFLTLHITLISLQNLRGLHNIISYETELIIRSCSKGSQTGAMVRIHDLHTVSPGFESQETQWW